MPGGSSGGSAAAVAARIAMAATGTDTGGSIRQPAAFCGVVGMKPTYGRCSALWHHRLRLLARSGGPVRTDVEDAALLLEVMAGHDPRIRPPSTAGAGLSAGLGAGVKGLRVGIPKEYRIDGMRPRSTVSGRKVRWLKAAGVEIVDVSLPHTKYALPTYYVIAPAESSTNLARYDGVHFGLRVAGGTLIDTYENTRAEGFGAEVKRRILIGTYVLSAGYYDAYYNEGARRAQPDLAGFHQGLQKCDAC